MYGKKELHPNLFTYKMFIINLIQVGKRKSDGLNYPPDFRFIKSFTLWRVPLERICCPEFFHSSTLH